MATESGNDEGYAVPVQLHPHTGALAALVMPDGCEHGTHDQHRPRDQVHLAQDAILSGTSREYSASGRYGVWVSPPAVLSIREQAKQLQQQKRAKQRQLMVLDANPDRFEPFPDFIGHEQEGKGFPSRSYQLVGGSADAVATPYRRDRDGGVLVPLRMMASLFLTDTTGVTAAGMAADPASEQAVPGGGRQLHEGQRGLSTDGKVRAQLVRAPPPGRVAAGTAAAARVNPLAMEAEDAERQLLGTAWREQQQEMLYEGLHDLDAAGALGPGALAGDAVTEGEDDGDGSMLIDVGSADRAAEGALLPTPERPRAAGAGTGWDALRGLGLRAGATSGTPSPDSASAGGGGGVTATLALLSAASLDDTRGVLARTPKSPHRAQPLQHMGSVSVLDAHGLPTGVPGQTRQLDGGRLLGQAAGGDADEGFDADDEGETARREERARAAFRLGGRSAQSRPLPGLTSMPPWHSLSGPVHASASASDPFGIISLGALALALPGTLSAAESAGLQHHRSHSTHLPGLDTAMASSSKGHGPAASGLADLRAVDGVGVLEPDPALVELLKLKCSLRRAVQGHNVQAMGLILSLLAALPATPGLLADSQIAALVSPLQQYGNAQVAAAARHLMVVWKSVLKAAARRPTSISGNVGPGPASTLQADTLARPAPSSQGPAQAPQRSPSFQRHTHKHHTERHPHPHAQQLLPRPTPRVAFATAVRHDACDCDTPLRDQAAGAGIALERPVSGPQESVEPSVESSERHLQGLGLSLARSQSDALAEGIAVVMGLGRVPARQDAVARRTQLPGLRTSAVVSRPGPGVELQGGAAQPSSSVPLAWEEFGQDAHQKCSEEEGLGAVERRRRVEPESGASGSRTPTEAEAESRSSGEETIDEGATVSGGHSGGGAAPGVEAGTQAWGGCERHGNGGRSGGGSGTTSGVMLHMQAIGPPATASGSAEPMPRVGTGAAAAVAAIQAPSPVLLPFCTPASLSSYREGASAGCSALGGSAAGVKAGAACALAGVLLSAAEASPAGRDNCDSPPAPVLPPPWRHGLAVPGCVPGSPETLGGPDGLPMAPLRPLQSMAVGPVTPTAVLMVAPPLSQPGGRKRKVERERPSSRRRGGNPSKRPAPPMTVGQFAGPRPLNPTLSMPPGTDAASGLSDDQRPQPPSHGPVTGLKTPARSSLLGLHAPLSKRQRHHAGSSIGQHGGGGHHTATQVRRMSLLLSSLDLGGPGPEGAGELAVAAAMEGDADADADADMGSQDDEAAMMTSDDDSLPYGNGAGSSDLKDATGVVRSAGTSGGVGGRTDGRMLSPPPPPEPQPPSLPQAERKGVAMSGQAAGGGDAGAAGSVCGFGVGQMNAAVTSRAELAPTLTVVPAWSTPVRVGPPLLDTVSAAGAHLRQEHDPAGFALSLWKTNTGSAEGSRAAGGSRPGEPALPGDGGAAPPAAQFRGLQQPVSDAARRGSVSQVDCFAAAVAGSNAAGTTSNSLNTSTVAGASNAVDPGDAGRLVPFVAI